MRDTDLIRHAERMNAIGLTDDGQQLYPGDPDPEPIDLSKCGRCGKPASECPDGLEPDLDRRVRIAVCGECFDRQHGITPQTLAESERVIGEEVARLARRARQDEIAAELLRVMARSTAKNSTANTTQRKEQVNEHCNA